MIKWNLADKLFSGFSIMRWTEYVRPTEFYEIEKHALKAAAAFVIGSEFEEKTKTELNWNKMVDNLVFAYLNKVATSDINSTVHARIKKESQEKLSEFILENYFDKDSTEKPRLFEENTIDYTGYYNFLRQTNFTVEDAILFFSHKFVTYREFEILEPLNRKSSEIKLVEIELNSLLDSSLNRVKDITRENSAILNDIFIRFRTEESTSYGLYRYFERLRPQIRWSQTQRIPKTTVAGHSLFVALLTYFMTKELLGIPFEDYYKPKENLVEKQVVVNNFFAALFHDLSEAFTRDVISPIKHNIDGLSDLLHEIEGGFIRDKILNKLELQYIKSANRLKLLLGYDYGKKQTERAISEFDDRKSNEGKKQYVVFGTLIKVADRISAFMEAKKSIDLGINTPDLQHGLKETQKALSGSIYKNPNNKSKNLSINDFLATIPHYAIDDQEIIGGRK